MSPPCPDGSTRAQRSLAGVREGQMGAASTVAQATSVTFVAQRGRTNLPHQCTQAGVGERPRQGYRGR